MNETTFTQEQLDKAVEEALTKAKEDWTKEKDNQFAQIRKRHEQEIVTIKENAKLSAEELAKKQHDEYVQNLETENATLKAYKKETEISARLSKEKLPSFFKNDSRLTSAQDEKELDQAIKIIKNEFAEFNPNGAPNSTVISGNGGNGGNQNTGKAFNEALRKACGR